MSGNLHVWLDHFSLETQITPVEVKKNFDNMIDHFKWRHPTSFDGADDSFRQLWCWQSRVDDVESTPAMRLATMMTMNKRCLLLRCLWWWRWQWWESDDVCAGCTAAAEGSTLKVVVLQREKETTHMLRQLSPPCILSSSFSNKLTIWRRLIFQHFTLDTEYFNMGPWLIFLKPLLI